MSSILSCVLVETTTSWLLLQMSGVTWKKVLFDKNENSESEYIFQYDFFFFPLYFSQAWKCYFLMSFKMYNTVSNYRRNLSVETTNVNKMDKVKFCSQAWSAVQNLRFSVCHMIFKWAYPESSILFARDKRYQQRKYSDSCCSARLE